VKRLLDVILAGAALWFSAPLLLFIVVAIKLDSPGPALFFQTRVGRGHRPIQITKLRTMRVGSEHMGAAFTVRGDRRVTRIGAILRSTKVDELPQLWNVLKGDMSLVGPRPEVARYVALYRPEWQKVLEVRPGLTDLASLTFRDEEKLLARARDRERAYIEVVMPMKLDLALTGLEHSSIIDDLGVMMRTLARVFGFQDDRSEKILEEALAKVERLNRES